MNGWRVDHAVLSANLSPMCYLILLRFIIFGRVAERGVTKPPLSIEALRRNYHRFADKGENAKTRGYLSVL